MTTEIIKKPFEKWNFEELEVAFGLQRIKRHPVLVDWLAGNKCEILQTDKKKLDELRVEVEDNVDTWNEEELKYYFMYPFLHLFNFHKPGYYKSFAQRKLTAIINDIELSGRVDLVIADGKVNPKAPYFCLHEYKKERGTDNDPLGQVLAAMLVTQTLNSVPHPIYGIYIVGRLWFFVILEDKEYSVSLAYDSTQKDIFDIYAILKKLKDVLDEFTAK